MSRKKSYYDDDYDQKAVKKRKFTLKNILQVTVLLFLMGLKRIKDTIVSLKSKHSDAGAPSGGSAKSEKNRRRRNRRRTFLLFVFMILFFVVMIYAFMSSVENEHERIVQFNTDAGSVCADYIKTFGSTNYENLYPINGTVGYRMTGLAFVRELDFDNDEKSELLLCYNDSGTYIVEVWGYDGDEFVTLYHGKAAKDVRENGDIWISLYRDGNETMIAEHDEHNIEKVKLLRLKRAEFETYEECTYNIDDEAFVVDEEVNYTSFERIRLAILREEKAAVTLDTVSAVLDGFKSTNKNQLEEGSYGKTLKGAYAKVIRDYIETIGEPEIGTDEGTCHIKGLAFVKQIDFNGDGVNELVIGYQKATKVRDEDYQGNYISVEEYRYVTEIYTFVDDAAKLVYQNENFSEKLNDNADRYLIIQKGSKRNKLCVNTFSVKEYGHVVTGSSTILKFDGTAFLKEFKAKYVNDYGYSTYYIDDNEVYRYEFEDQGYVVPFFDGENSYNSSKYDIYYVQRSKANEKDVKAQLEDTKAEISSFLDR